MSLDSVVSSTISILGGITSTLSNLELPTMRTTNCPSIPAAGTIAPSETSRACTPAIDSSGESTSENTEHCPYAFKSPPSTLRVVDEPTEDKEEPNSVAPSVSPKRGTKRKQRDGDCSRYRVEDCDSSQMSMGSADHRNNKRMLVSGFIRGEFTKKYQSHSAVTEWPCDITNVVLRWYEETSYWLIRGESMKQFRSLSNGQTMYGPKFSVGRLLEFDTTLCPKGWKSKQDGSCQFYIELSKLPKDTVSSVTVYYELRCGDTDSHCKKIRTFKKETDAQSWGTNNMRFTETDGLQSFEMATFVRVLRIQYTKSYRERLERMEIERPLFIPERITMSRQMAYQWTIGRAQIDRLTACAEGKFFYSPNFGGNCFCFEIAPNGWHITNRGQCMLYLRLLGLPQRVRSIWCECEFGGDLEPRTRSPSGRKVYRLPSGRTEHGFSYQNHGVHWNLEDALCLDTLRSMDRVQFSVNIRIKRVLDLEGKVVAPEQWADYDICS